MKPVVDVGENPYVIDEPDPLLSKLLEEHGNRRYEELNFKRKEKLNAELS